jgi:hypothetical protein
MVAGNSTIYIRKRLRVPVCAHRRYTRIMPRLSSLAAVLLAWNVLGPLMWIGFAEARAVTRASNEHGHVQDVEERLELMHREMDVITAGTRPFYPIVLIIAAINVGLAVLILMKIARNPAVGGEDSASATVR